MPLDFKDIDIAFGYTTDRLNNENSFTFIAPDK